jgi:IPT/TIG domain
MAAPTITYVQPSLSVPNLEETIIVNGTNFDNTAVVKVNGAPATITNYVSSLQVTATLYTGIMLEVENKITVTTTSGGTSNIYPFMKAGLS